jgi:hypothetical protein
MSAQSGAPRRQILSLAAGPGDEIAKRPNGLEKMSMDR